mmetsp:Transcript_21530/g.32041  ORF Transcript_21530/g.32041 Transcript_21530/m.32041 type:complete len:207 (-) Transcript_21530:174-794(-)
MEVKGISAEEQKSIEILRKLLLYVQSGKPEVLKIIKRQLDKLSPTAFESLAQRELTGIPHSAPWFKKSMLNLLCYGDSILARLQKLEAKGKWVSKYLKKHGQSVPSGLVEYVGKRGQIKTAMWLQSLGSVQSRGKDCQHFQKLAEREKERVAEINACFDAPPPQGVYSKIVEGFKSPEYKKNEMKAIVKGTVKALFLGGLSAFMDE